MSYSDADRRVYVFPAVDYGAGNFSHSFRGPKGKAAASSTSICRPAKPSTPSPPTA